MESRYLISFWCWHGSKWVVYQIFLESVLKDLDTVPIFQEVVLILLELLQINLESHLILLVKDLKFLVKHQELQVSVPLFRGLERILDRLPCWNRHL